MLLRLIQADFANDLLRLDKWSDIKPLTCYWEKCYSRDEPAVYIKTADGSELSYCSDHAGHAIDEMKRSVLRNTIISLKANKSVQASFREGETLSESEADAYNQNCIQAHSLLGTMLKRLEEEYGEDDSTWPNRIQRLRKKIVDVRRFFDSMGLHP